MFKPRLVAALLAATVAGCEKPPPAPPQPRPVRTVTIERHAEGQLMALTGQVRAKDEASVYEPGPTRRCMKVKQKDRTVKEYGWRRRMNLASAR